MVRRKKPKGLERLRLLHKLRGLGRRWFLKLAAIALVAGFIAFNATVAAVANIARNQSPHSIARLFDDPIASVLAIQLELTSPQRLLAPDVEPAALEALRYEPLNSLPLRLLAMQAAMEGRREVVQRFLLLSERVSRRDVLTQLVLIEQAVEADDIAGAVSHYDKALRTSDESRTILFPVLGAAIADPAIRDAVVPYIRRRAPWVSDFVRSAITNGETGPRSTARLLIRAGSPPDLMQKHGALVMGGLVERQDFALAQQLFAHMPGANPDILQNIGFTSETVDPAFVPFSWMPTNTGSSGVAFESSVGAGARRAHLFAGAGERLVLLRRWVALRPGNYAHSEIRTLTATDRTSRAFWEMRCVIDGALRTFWRGPEDRVLYQLENAPGPNIPNACTHQSLELTVSVGDGQQGLDFAIERFSLNRIAP